MTNKRKNLQADNKLVKAADGDRQHTASFNKAKENQGERITLCTRCRHLGYNVDCDFLQQGPVAAPVSIFWRFAVASVTMLTILLVTRRLRPLRAKDHLCCLLQGCCVFCFNFWCFYTAAAWINTGLESVIFSMAVLFNAINSFLFFRQQPPGALLGRRRAGSGRYRHPFLG